MTNNNFDIELFEFAQNEINIYQNEISTYQKEIAKLKNIIENTNLCICCYDSKAVYAALPCGHLIFCQKCYTQFNSKNCPVCSTTISKLNKIYFSNFY